MTSFQVQLRAAGLSRMRFHDLRHAHATLMLAAGVPLVTISKSLGHTSIATTAAVYAHVLPELQRDAASPLGRPDESAKHRHSTTGRANLTTGLATRRGRQLPSRPVGTATLPPPRRAGRLLLRAGRRLVA